MKASAAVLAVSKANMAVAAAVASASSASAPTIHLCGDSTMANMSGVIQGWGQYLHYSFDPARFTVVNSAIAGRSARSYTREGRFAAVLKQVQPGDWVVIEFGHNDGGGLSKDNGRSDCFGAGDETCQTTYDGKPETVQTYPTYLKQAGAAFLKAGAKLVLSAPTPNDVWSDAGVYSWGPDRFAYYAMLAAEELGGTKAGAYFVPHGAYAAQAMKALGSDVVRKNYPQDHTHTSPFLADVMAGAFVLGLTCGTSDLGKATLNSTAALSGTFFGGCIAYNSTVPL
ncbi:rhamnogalacturonan acetylesterase [Sporothrix schenckii 1099-18]|uniref:Uncharacterized protein n=2 Tax=Sporothrix schenckii TaxID=29908 RepID=U7Q221_SPOS1|nr:rhamnogalacturonan acetylesterase [Sporothrix schenckii 1099-18]ERT01924.1 hypothetical protein HMPREF1624_00219 [Sporothrix schenckii ATCC 58251]KJR80923.1 rhamnogalacturonan acetylesterase [Sporothrix schenckii 1099-18]